MKARMNETPVIQTATASNSGQSDSQPSRLCQACLSVLARNELELEIWYPHHNDLKDFIEASQLKCYICSWKFDALPEHAKHRLELLAEGQIRDAAITREFSEVYGFKSDREAKLHESIQSHWRHWARMDQDKDISWKSFTGMKIEFGDEENHLRISVLLDPLYEGYFPLTMTAYHSEIIDLWETVEDFMSRAAVKPVIVTHQDYLQLSLMTGELPPNTGSMGTWTTVAGWIKQCSERHPCLSQINPKWYPTRLIEILSNDRFRVIRSDSECIQSEKGYVTLSHRWGGGDFVKLTTNNLVDFEIGCPVATLRKAFQDAILVASRMKIPYLWIDSLCIIQSGDGGADWREESTRMAEVYSNSFCNISADWGDEDNGLFFERTGSFEPPCELYMRFGLRYIPDWLREALPSPSSLLLAGGLCHILRPCGWLEDVMKSPLNRRGWVLQERQLAPRILHFSRGGVSWECRVKTAWERIPLGFSDGEYGRFATSCGLLECSTLSRMSRLRLSELGVPVDWQNLMRQYAFCDLTKDSDRLVAVAGIAKMLAATAKDRYAAGLWSKSLPRALLWSIFERQSHSLSPTASYFTPSFSWAAAEGTVEQLPYCRDILDNTSATFIHYREKPVSSYTDKMIRAELSGQLLRNDIFGPITYPEVEVRMKGMLRSCRQIPLRLVPKGVFSTSYACPSADFQDSAISSCFKKGTEFYVKFDRVAEEDEQLKSIMYYYTIISYTSFTPPSLDHQPGASLSYLQAYGQVEGILLKSVDPGMGRFERVGHLIHSQVRPGLIVESILPPLGNERELPALSYDEITRQHTFFIV